MPIQHIRRGWNLLGNSVVILVLLRLCFVFFLSYKHKYFMRDKKPISQMCRESINITISNDTNDRWNSIVRDEKNKIKLMSSKNSKKGKGRKSKYRRIKHQILQ